jgi:SAM-dependent methyltransferase
MNEAEAGRSIQYVFMGGDERDRLILQHDAFKPFFLEAIERLFSDYGLEQRLQQATTQTHKFQILDVGCGEGLFVQDVAEVLEKRHLLEGVTLIGIDQDVMAITLANDFKTLYDTEHPRPYLQFFTHDATVPLEDNPVLVEANLLQFDLIYATLTFEHIRSARSQIERLYRRNLKPGGLLFLRDAVIKEGEGGWVAPTPAMCGTTQSFVYYIASWNDGLEVASLCAEWLRELGASQVQTSMVRAEASTGSDQSLKILQNWLLAIQNSLPSIVKAGRMSQADADALLPTILEQLSAESLGFWTMLDTFALKASV